MSFFDTVTKHLFPVPVLVIGLAVIVAGTQTLWKKLWSDPAEKKGERPAPKRKPYTVPPEWAARAAAADKEGFQINLGTGINNTIAAAGSTVQNATGTAATLADNTAATVASAIFGSNAVSVGPTGGVVGSAVGNTAGNLAGRVAGSVFGSGTGSVVGSTVGTVLGTGVTTALNTTERAVGPAIKLVNSLFAAGAGCTAESTPTPARTLGPYRKNAAGVEDTSIIGTNFNDVVNPAGRKFEETPLDSAYDEYELGEMKAQVEESDRLSQEVVIVEEEVGDVGATFSPTDYDITNIPWDAENKDSSPKDVLWGFVSREASKSLFLKAYKQAALTVPDAVQDLKPGDDSSPPAFNLPNLPVDPVDPYASTAIETLKGIGVAIGQEFNPLAPKDVVEDYDLTKPDQRAKWDAKNSSMFEISPSGETTGINKKLKYMDMKRQKLDAQNMKGAGPKKKMKALYKKIKLKIQKKIMEKLQKFMQKKMIKGIIMQATAAANAAAANSAAVASFGVLAFLAVIANFILFLVTTVLGVVDRISEAAAILLPVILEKLLDGEGICPPGSKTINEIIPDETAYFFFTSFVPIGDLADLFAPYVCWDGLDTTIKQRVFEPTYTQDKTLSLAYHMWPEDMKTKGDEGNYGRDFNNSIEGYTCTNGICRKNCGTGTVAEGDLCRQLSVRVESLNAPLKDCAVLKRDKGDTSAQQWVEQAGTGVCFEPYNQAGVTCKTETTTEYNFETGGFTRIVCEGNAANRGCGCVRATKAERAYCDTAAGYKLDTNDLRCYKCPAGMERQGNLCLSPVKTYARDTLVLEDNKWKVVPGYNLPETLDGLTVGPNDAQPGFPNVKPYTPFCNFASPVMLDRMAQFYYEQSYLKPDILEVNFVDPGDKNPGANAIFDTPENRKIVDLSGGPLLVQWDYISRFYGVIASSELSCDVACELRTITYNPITGASFTEQVGCSNVGDSFDTANDYQKANNRCYRRFYFTKLTTDPQGIFTVTGCTNTDGTAPDAEVNSWDEGVEYVPSLPKVFTQRICDKPTEWGMDDLVKIGINYGGEQISGSLGPVGGLLAGPAVSYMGGKLTEEIDKSKAEGTTGTPYLTRVNANGQEQFLVTANINYVTPKNTPATALINTGPIVEQATGVVPIVKRCEAAILTDAICGHKYNLRDTIREYEKANPTRRVKQVDVIEPRGGGSTSNHGCYYRWKEVDYDPATNKEAMNFRTKEIIYKYAINDLKTCVFRPVGLVDNFSETDYPIRTVTINGSLMYPTRKKVTKPVRFVRIEGGKEVLQLSQIVVINTDFINISKGRVPTATDPFDSLTPATDATDGNAVARAYPNIYHSKSGNAFFEIDLGKEHFIQMITVYNRQEPSGDNLGLAKRWDGYTLKCLDSSRAVNYSFALSGSMVQGGVTVPRYEQTFTDFPAIDLQRRRPYKSFAVPLGLPPDVTLGGGTVCPTKCSDEGQVTRLMQQFNEANADRKIMKVLKAWTPKPDRCEFEVEMMRVQPDGSKRFSKETTFLTVAREGTTCLFNRVSDGSANVNSGTYIQYNTPALKFGSGLSEKNGISAYESVTNAVTGVFGSMIQTLQNKKPLDRLREEAVKAEKETSAVLSYVAANQTLQGCPTKCSDPSVLAAISKRYNETRGTLTEQFGAERSIMTRILRAVGAGPTECDVMYEEQFEAYEDALYPPIQQEKRIKAVRVKMVDQGKCTWAVAAGDAAITDVSGAAAGLKIANFARPVCKNTSPPWDMECLTQYLLSQRWSAKGTAMPAQAGMTEWNKQKTWDALKAYAKGLKEQADITYNPPLPLQQRALAIQRVYGVTVSDPATQAFARAVTCSSEAPYDPDCVTEYLLSQGWSLNGTGMPAKVGMSYWNKYTPWKALEAQAAKWKQDASVGTDTADATDAQANAILFVYGVSVQDPSSKPFPVLQCPVNCRDPARLKEIQGQLNAAGSKGSQAAQFRQVVQSFQPTAMRCEYKILKDIITTDPYTKRSNQESDIETYVTADFAQQLAAGATTCTGVKHVMASLQEFPSDPDVEIDPNTGEEVYMVENAIVTPPMLFTYDPSTAVSPRVNATAVNM